MIIAQRPPRPPPTKITETKPPLAARHPTQKPEPAPNNGEPLQAQAERSPTPPTWPPHPREQDHPPQANDTTMEEKPARSA